MDVGSLVLLHSPLLRAGVLSRLSAELVGRGVAVVAPDIADDDQPPYGVRYVARAALSIAQAAAPSPPLVLVGHGEAGPLLPQVAAALRAGNRLVAVYVFCDATLPRASATRLALLEGEDPQRAGALHERLHDGGRLTTWPDTEVARLDDADVVSAWARPRAHDFYVEPLPMPPDWPDAPCGYLKLSDERPALPRTARFRGWPVTGHDVGHFGIWSSPGAVADGLLELLDLM